MAAPYLASWPAGDLELYVLILHGLDIEANGGDGLHNLERGRAFELGGGNSGTAGDGRDWQSYLTPKVSAGQAK